MTPAASSELTSRDWALRTAVFQHFVDTPARPPSLNSRSRLFYRNWRKQRRLEHQRANWSRRLMARDPTESTYPIHTFLDVVHSTPRDYRPSAPLPSHRVNLPRYHVESAQLLNVTISNNPRQPVFSASSALLLPTDSPVQSAASAKRRQP